jgi:hypothetical protein
MSFTPPHATAQRQKERTFQGNKPMARNAQEFVAMQLDVRATSQGSVTTKLIGRCDP